MKNFNFEKMGLSFRITLKDGKFAVIISGVYGESLFLIKTINGFAIKAMDKWLVRKK
jgi:hypothetical protein